MYNALLLNNNYYDVQEVEEKVQFTLQAYFNLNNFSAYNVPLDDRFSISIMRNLADDTFNTTLFHPEIKNFRNINSIFTIANLNNDFVVNSAYAGQYPNQSMRDLVHHSLFQSTPFAKASFISFDFMFDNSYSQSNATILNAASPLFNLTITPRRQAVVATSIARPRTALIVRTLKELRVRFNATQIENKVPITEQDKGVFIVEKYYNNMLIIPAVVSRTMPITSVFDLYSFNDNSTPTTFDSAIGKASYKSTTFPSGLDVEYEIPPESSQKPNVFLLEPSLKIFAGKAAHIATLQVHEQVSYNYEKDRFEKGTTATSFTGDNVPYNLVGDFNQEIDLAINTVFSKFKLTTINHFSHKYLDPFTGQVSLKITESVIVEIRVHLDADVYTLVLENIKVIRDENKNKSYVPLYGLLNFAKNY